MEKWRENYNRYMYKSSSIIAEGLGDPSILHYCPSCGAYLWADDRHYSYRFCTQCGRNLKNKKLPYEII